MVHTFGTVAQISVAAPAWRPTAADHTYCRLPRVPIQQLAFCANTSAEAAATPLPNPPSPLSPPSPPPSAVHTERGGVAASEVEDLKPLVQEALDDFPLEEWPGVLSRFPLGFPTLVGHDFLLSKIRGLDSKAKELQGRIDDADNGLQAMSARVEELQDLTRYVSAGESLSSPSNNIIAVCQERLLGGLGLWPRKALCDMAGISRVGEY